MELFQGLNLLVSHIQNFDLIKIQNYYYFLLFCLFKCRLNSTRIFIFLVSLKLRVGWVECCSVVIFDGFRTNWKLGMSSCLIMTCSASHLHQPVKLYYNFTSSVVRFASFIGLNFAWENKKNFSINLKIHLNFWKLCGRVLRRETGMKNLEESFERLFLVIFMQREPHYCPAIPFQLLLWNI